MSDDIKETPGVYRYHVHRTVTVSTVLDAESPEAAIQMAEELDKDGVCDYDVDEPWQADLVPFGTYRYYHTNGHELRHDPL